MRIIGAWVALVVGLWATVSAAQPIDRLALVSRHNPHLTAVDPHASLMLGNGALGFTADITGLQTFPEAYSHLSPLMTMAQWGWHSFPNPQGFSEPDGKEMVPVFGREPQAYDYFKSFDEMGARPALSWLRDNPHRFALGRVGLVLIRSDGTRAVLSDLTATDQKLDMWTGTLTSRFVFDGQSVTVETRVAADKDVVLVRIVSPLVAQGRVGAELRYSGVAKALSPDPQDWQNSEAHRTEVVARDGHQWTLKRTLDDTVYYGSLAVSAGVIRQAEAHRFEVLAQGADELIVQVGFGREASDVTMLDYPQAVAKVADHWRDYWVTGGVIDFTGSTDARAHELERRVVLSQYLMKVNGSGALPPQEEGLYSVSWAGKFHLEMHMWHAAHFAQWQRPELLERSLDWYVAHLPEARKAGAAHGIDGAWWPKMAGPEGRNSPSPIGPFIMWQQPHPIYMAELVYRANPSPEVISRYGELVEATAGLLAQWPVWDEATGRYVLGPPIIPVQENYDPFTTFNPIFEIEYFRLGLEMAQSWRERQGLARNPQWDQVIAKLAKPVVKDGLYIPVENKPDFWVQAASAECSGHAPEHCDNRDHPSFLMAYGLIGGAHTDPAIMKATLRATEAHWDMRQTWGWDFPVAAMTAARVGDPEAAIDWLFKDLRNNQWGVSGMTPRVHIDSAGDSMVAESARKVGPDGVGFRRAAETYFPSNGSLLLAVGMMAAGWDGASGHAPGFPKDGWVVRYDNIKPLP
ncbi:MAG: hypothetical protein QM645_00150 [Asticcacaulis sp.]